MKNLIIWIYMVIMPISSATLVYLYFTKMSNVILLMFAGLALFAYYVTVNIYFFWNNRVITFPLRTAFVLNLCVIAFFGISALIFKSMLLAAIAFIFLLILPACSTKK